jgi:hypothetical protein
MRARGGVSHQGRRPERTRVDRGRPARSGAAVRRSDSCRLVPEPPEGPELCSPWLARRHADNTFMARGRDRQLRLEGV